MANLQKLPQDYNDLSTAITQWLPVKHTYITEYHDPTLAANGLLCSEMIFPGAVDDKEGWLKGTAADFLEGYSDGIVPGDAIQWVHTNFLATMNNIIHSSAVAHGWIPVGGISDEFTTHGYCAPNHWVVQYQESMSNQGNTNGTMHPNAPGQAVFARHLFHTMLQTMGTGMTSGRRDSE